MHCSDCDRPMTPKASARWELTICADGGRRRVFHLCAICDEALNDHILRVMGDARRRLKMDRYRSKK